MRIENAECIQLTKGLIRFLQDSPTSFHAVANIAGILREAGFTELHEGEKWELKKNGSYFVTRNQSSILSFRIPAGTCGGYQIMASHSDSPTFKIKENPEACCAPHGLTGPCQWPDAWW